MYKAENLTMTEEESRVSFWKNLSSNEIEREDGTKRAFDLESDVCRFWQEIHSKGYADGLTPARIAEYVAPLWVHEILTMDDLIKNCVNNYAEAKANLFLNKSGAIGFFERHFPNIKEFKRADVTLKYSGGEKYELKNVVATVDAIKAAVRRLPGGKFEIAGFELYDPNEMEVRENSDLSRLPSPWVLSVKSIQIGFSKVPDLKTALKMCGENTNYQAHVPVEQFMTDAVANTIKEDPNFAKELEHAWGTIQKLQKVHPNDYGNETTTRSYISPVVIAAAMLSKGITFGEEVKIEGPYGKGPVDYAFKYKDTIVCVTEVKDQDMAHGLRQNIAQLAATSSERKRKFAAMNDNEKFTYYGIATTSYIWHLIELNEKGVKSSERIIGCDEKELISGVIAHIVNVLNKCKKNYDDRDD